MLTARRLPLATFVLAVVACLPGAVAAQEPASPAAAAEPESEADVGPRKHASGAFEVGAIGSEGFGAGFAGAFGWDLSDIAGIEIAAGVGGKQGRGGGAVGGVYSHFDLVFPVSFNVCASIPRVCPALDLEVALLPGVGYAYLDGIHAGNVVLGFSVESLRKTQDLDVGVRAAVLAYLDVIGSAVEGDGARVLSMVTLQLGFVVRWGVLQP